MRFTPSGCDLNILIRNSGLLNTPTQYYPIRNEKQLRFNRIFALRVKAGFYLLRAGCEAVLSNKFRSASHTGLGLPRRSSQLLYKQKIEQRQNIICSIPIWPNALAGSVDVECPV
jgi:hypothetical protein